MLNGRSTVANTANKRFANNESASPIELNTLPLAHCSNEALGSPLMHIHKRTLETVSSAQKQHIFVDASACQTILIDLPCTRCMFRILSESCTHILTFTPSHTLTLDIMFRSVHAHTLLWHVLPVAKTRRCPCPHPGIPCRHELPFAPLCAPPRPTPSGHATYLQSPRGKCQLA